MDTEQKLKTLDSSIFHIECTLEVIINEFAELKYHLDASSPVHETVDNIHKQIAKKKMEYQQKT